MEIRFRLNRICKVYPPTGGGKGREPVRALDNLDIKIYDKKINALTGPSGCGKSTLARILMGLENADSGEISYMGQPIHGGSGLSRKALQDFRKKNQLMFQSPYVSVNPCFTVRQIVEEPLRIRVNRRGPAGAKGGHAAVPRLMELLEIPSHFLDRFPSELSGGELQRVVLARTLVLEPEFVILDEPFSALDDITANRLMRQFKHIFQHLGTGVLYISHHAGRVHFMADVLTVMERGRVRSQRTI